MRFKKLGRSGLLVSDICLGTMTFGYGAGWSHMGALDQKAGADIVKVAFDRGVNFFDTADVYGNGRSETVLGASIKSLGLHRDEMVIATKCGQRIGGWGDEEGLTEEELIESRRRRGMRNLNGTSRKRVMDAIDGSLQRLGLDHVDLYQLHSFDPLTPFEESLEAMNDVVRAGKARYIGVSNYAAWQVAKCLGISERRNLARFQSIQLFYSIGGRDMERELGPLAQEEGLGILPWSPLAGGFFSGKFTRESAGEGRRTQADFPPVDKDKAYDIIDVMKKIADAKGTSVARVGLAWLLHKPVVTSVIIGAKTTAQLEDNLAATDLKLSAEDMKALDDVSALKREYPQWMQDRQTAGRLNQI